MRHVKLVVEYDGTDFAGWQRQANALSVQQVLEDELGKMVGHAVTLRGAGRTDSGVHARGQVASFRTESTIPLLGFQRGLNGAMPRTIAVVAAEEVPDAFDARRWTDGKHYAYRVWTREARTPLYDRFCWHMPGPMDVAAMQQAGAVLVGRHDFSAFRAADCDRKNPVRELRRVDVSRAGDLVTLDVEGTAFLKHMVRVIAGTLVEVGVGRRTPAEVAEILAGRDRTRAGRTAPPKGLTLERVFVRDSAPPPRND